MGTGASSFPAASSSSVPATYFYISDPADTTHEIVQVINVSGTTWTVVRGAGSTSPVAHATGATWVQEISHLTLQNFKQTPSAVSSAVTVANTATETVLATYTPTSDELVAGATWEVLAFGTYAKANGVPPSLQLAMYWGGSGAVGSAFTSTGSALMCKMLTGATTAGNVGIINTTLASGSGWDLNGEIVWLSSTTATANMNVWFNNASAINSAPVTFNTVNTSATTPFASNATPVTISGGGPVILTVKWSAAASTSTITATAPLIRRAA